jgi:hypothetical protein
MAIQKMNQLLAVEKTVKGKREDQFTVIYRDVQKPELATGLVKTYQPKDENGEKFPPDSKRVQVRIEESLKNTVASQKEIFNLTAKKDATNCAAKANIVYEGEVIAKDVPATHLLWLEKKLLSLADFITKLPTLSQDIVWSWDAGQSLYRSEPVETVKTAKIEDWKSVAAATKEHPEQIQKFTKDVIVGIWKTVHLSGAIPVNRKAQLLDRVEKFQRAVKEAREEANQTPVTELATGNIVELLFAP